MKKRSSEYKKSKKYQRKQILLLGVIVISIISLCSVFGRYATERINSFFTRTKEFYFNSDKLAQNTAKYQVDNWSGVDDYIITINMNSYLNNLVATSYDIEYDISYTSSNNIICQLNKQSGVIAANTHTDYFNITVTPNTTFKTGDKAWIEIIATSKTNYTKTLKAQFTLVVGKENLSYEIADSAKKPYLELKITNTLSYYTVKESFDSYTVGQKIEEEIYRTLSEENKKKCYSADITLQFNPQEVLLDMTNANYLKASQVGKIMVEGHQYINSISFTMEAVSSTNIRFYKVDSRKRLYLSNGRGKIGNYGD